LVSFLRSKTKKFKGFPKENLQKRKRDTNSNNEYQHILQQLLEQYSKSNSTEGTSSQEADKDPKSATPNTGYNAAEDHS